LKACAVVHQLPEYDIAIDIDNPEEWMLPFSVLYQASLLLRMDMYTEELASIQANSPDSSFDLDKVLFGWALKTHLRSVECKMAVAEIGQEIFLDQKLTRPNRLAVGEVPDPK